jgi:hypothetical protein
MFFKPYVIERLVDVDYGFADAGLREASLEFRSSLKATQEDLRNDGIPLYLPLDDIASSVQF